MINILFPEKIENNNIIKANKLDLNFKPKNKKYNNININNEFFQSTKKSEISNNNKDESSIRLSSAYQNISSLISNCLESYRAENNENEVMKNPRYSLKFWKKQTYSKLFQDSNKNSKSINKSVSLSNSSNFLLKNSDNILSHLNNEKGQIYINKINNKKFEKAISLNNQNNISLNGKINSLLNKRQTVSSLFSPKRNANKSRNYFHINHKKEYELELNKEKILSKLEKKNKSSSKVPKIRNSNMLKLSNFMSNYDMSTISIRKKYKLNKGKKSKSLNNYRKKNDSKTEIISIKNLNKKEKEISLNKKPSSKKFNKYFSLNNFSSDHSKITEEEIKKFQNSLKNSKISDSVMMPTKTFQNVIDSRYSSFANFNEQYKKQSFIKNRGVKSTGREHLKILTLKEIGKNLKKTIIDFNLDKLKKQLYEFENNEYSEMINNLPNNNEENENNNRNNNKETINSKTNLNQTSINPMITNYYEESYIGYLTKKGINENLRQYRYRKLFLIKKVYDSLDDDENIDEDNLKSIYLPPNSLFVYIIDFFILISSFYELVYLPLFLAYYSHQCSISFISIKSLLFYFIDLLYIIDLISSFFRAYFDFEEILIRTNSDICINYLTGWFFLDLIEAIPFFSILNLNENQCDEMRNRNNHLNYFYDTNFFHYSLLVLKMAKIFKVFSNNRALIKIINFLNQNNFFYNWRAVFFSLLITLSSLHFCSCFFIFLGKNIYPGWIVLCNLQSSNFYHIYVAAVYYLMTTLTTVGYGDILVNTKYERFYQIIILIVGTCAYSWILTFISNYIKKHNEKYIDYEKKVEILGEIKFNYPLLSNELYDKILRYLNYNKSEYKYNVENILDSLPSSLQNSLIVEIYKPIIRNFHFFKSFENSDFFVKIVTSLKPILSMKDDILVQEGDVIEDIIFIKRGILTLEILIDLDSPKESAEDHLNMTGIGGLNIFSKNLTKKTERGTMIQNNSIFSQNTNNMNFSAVHSRYLTKNEKKIHNLKSMKILELRKNEHYGDVLMILNERSPLTVKVKSKKAELFLLQKVDATEISNQYPNIWKRIVNKSLYNMKQIKNLIRKKLINFCDLNDIGISPELKKQYLEEKEINNTNNKNAINKKISNRKYRKNGQKKQIDTIIYEEDENFDSMCNAYTLDRSKYSKDKKIFYSSKNLMSKLKKMNEKERTRFSNLSLNYKNIKNSYTNNDINNDKKTVLIDELSYKSSKSNNDSKQEKITIDIDDKKLSSKKDSVCNLNNMISIIDERMKSNKGQINNFNINIFTPKAVQIPINQINNSHCPSESNKTLNNDEDITNIKINEEFHYNEDFHINIMKDNIVMNNTDKNNNIIYPNFRRLFGNEIIKSKKNFSKEINIKKLLDNKNNGNNENNEYILNDKDKIEINENKENHKNILEIKYIKNNKFLNLDSSKNISFTINSIYENINQLTKYQFKKNTLLRQKTINFLIKHSLSNQNSVEYSLSPKKQKVDSSIISPAKRNRFGSANSKNNSNYNDKLEEESKSKNTKKTRFYSTDNGNMAISSSKNLKANDLIRNKKKSNSNYCKIKCNKSIMNYSNISQDNNFYRRKFKKSILNSEISECDDKDNEKNLYNRVKTFRKTQKNKGKEKMPPSSSTKKVNLKDKISRNIEKNTQNLKNPEEYFSGFFKDILQNKKILKKTNIKEQKKMHTLFYKNKNDSKNIIKNNNDNIKRISTVDERIDKAHANKRFKI